MQNNPAFTDPSQAETKAPRSTLVSRNVTISGHRTSVRLEPEMWSALSEICRREGGSLHQVCTVVATRKSENTSLTAAIRVFVMAYYRAAASEDGHTKAGHGYGIATMCGNAPAATPRSVSAAVSPTASTAPVYAGGMTNRMSPTTNNGSGRLR